jgi:hypothetical protein
VKAIHEGGCLCGAIRYRVKEPARALTHCHCRSCRLAVGAPSVAWAIFPRDAFEFTAGEPVHHASSAKVIRGFCGACGTSLTWQHEDRPSTMDVTIASLDDAHAFAPTREIWIGEKLAWQALDPALPHYPRSGTDSQAVVY